MTQNSAVPFTPKHFHGTLLEQTPHIPNLFSQCSFYLLIVTKTWFLTWGHFLPHSPPQGKWLIHSSPSSTSYPHSLSMLLHRGMSHQMGRPSPPDLPVSHVFEPICVSFLPQWKEEFLSPSKARPLCLCIWYHPFPISSILANGLNHGTRTRTIKIL